MRRGKTLPRARPSCAPQIDRDAGGGSPAAPAAAKAAAARSSSNTRTSRAGIFRCGAAAGAAPAATSVAGGAAAAALSATGVAGARAKARTRVPTSATWDCEAQPLRERQCGSDRGNCRGDRGRHALPGNFALRLAMLRGTSIGPCWGL